MLRYPTCHYCYEMERASVAQYWIQAQARVRIGVSFPLIATLFAPLAVAPHAPVVRYSAVASLGTSIEIVSTLQGCN